MKEKLDSKKIMTHINPTSPIAEQIRTIRTNISFLEVQKKKFKTLLVTSAEVGSGKSTFSANLAISFAQQGKKTLLIDADLRKPTVHKTFIRNQYVGLSSVLNEQLDLEDSYQKTEIDLLSILTSGTKPPNPSELLGTNMMDQILIKVSHQFDQVIIDAPPATVVSDPLILAPKIDGIILVCHAGKTLRGSAKAAMEHLSMSKTAIVGCVLNGVKGQERYYTY